MMNMEISMILFVPLESIIWAPLWVHNEDREFILNVVIYLKTDDLMNFDIL